jgi:hypothetical protein
VNLLENTVTSLAHSGKEKLPIQQVKSKCEGWAEAVRFFRNMEKMWNIE